MAWVRHRGHRERTGFGPLSRGRAIPPRMAGLRCMPHPSGLYQSKRKASERHAARESLPRRIGDQMTKNPALAQLKRVPVIIVLTLMMLAAGLLLLENTGPAVSPTRTVKATGLARVCVGS